MTGILTTTSDTVTALLAGATAGPREAYRQSKLRGDAASGEDLQPYQSVALSTAKGMGRIVTASLMTPVTFTGAVAQGFHNAPRLYGDDTVREPAKVTGWRSGFIEAGKVCLCAALCELCAVRTDFPFAALALLMDGT